MMTLDANFNASGGNNCIRQEKIPLEFPGCQFRRSARNRDGFKLAIQPVEHAE